MAQFMKVASTADLAPGEAKCVEVAGKKIALFNLEGEEVVCPWHGAVYNIKTGAVLGPPAPRGVQPYPVRIQGSDVEVQV